MAHQRFILLTLLLSMSALSSIAQIAHADDFDMNDDRTLEEIAQDALSSRPSWGVQFSGAYKALGSGINYTTTQGMTSQAFLFEGEYQPVFLQTFGILGFGPSIGIYPTTGTDVTTGNGLTQNEFDIWEIGGQIRYQARYFDNQILVPFAAYQMQLLNYSLQYGPTGRIVLHGGSVGLSFLLNALDKQQALRLFKNTNVSRAYFFVQGTSLTGNDSNISVSGVSLFFGLRCEL